MISYDTSRSHLLGCVCPSGMPTPAPWATAPDVACELGSTVALHAQRHVVGRRALGCTLEASDSPASFGRFLMFRSRLALQPLYTTVFRRLGHMRAFTSNRYCRYAFLEALRLAERVFGVPPDVRWVVLPTGS